MSTVTPFDTLLAPAAPTLAAAPLPLTVRIARGGAGFMPHAHADDIRVVVPETWARVAVDPRHEGDVLQAPHVCVVAPGHALHLAVDAGAQAIVIAVDGMHCEERAIRVLGRPSPLRGIAIGEDPALRDLAASLHSSVTDHTRAQSRRSIGDELSLHLAAHYGQPEPPSTSAGLSRVRLERVLSMIDERLASPLPVAELADAVHMSPFHFSRMFKVSTGRSPHEWITSKRMARAKALLAQTRMALSDVARTCGYRTHAHFSGMFHAAVGVTPGQYRARHA
jgi:AraC family transcriptional regulator